MKHFVLVLQGLVLGITAVIPGISIGTMALVLGVYERSIESLVVIFSPRGWRNFALLRRGVIFITPLAFGGILSMMGFARLLRFFMEHNAIFVSLMFFGILLGSIPHLFSAYVRPLYKHIDFKAMLVFCACFFTGAAIILFLSGSGEKPIEHAISSVDFIAGIRALVFGVISASAGVIPGISGSYVLLLLGYFKTYLTIICTPVIPLLIPLLIGSVLGLVWIAVLINIAFKKFQKISYTIVLGIMAGSLFRTVPISEVAALSKPQFALGLACVALGVVLVLLSTKLSGGHLKKQHLTKTNNFS